MKPLGFTITVGDDDPLYLHEWRLLLHQCRASLARRAEAYPAMVKRGQISAGDAARDIAAWELLVAEWTWIVRGPEANGARAPMGANALAARRAAIALGLQRIKEEVDRGGGNHQLLHQSHCHQALRHHLEDLDPTGEPKVHACARINHAHRAAIGLRCCTACDRWETEGEVRACDRADCPTAPEQKEAA